MITRPKLILADEPTGNLDSKNSQDVMDLLTQAARHYQQTILMITHNNNLTEPDVCFLYYPFGVSRNGYFRYGGYVYPGTDFAGSV